MKYVEMCASDFTENEEFYVFGFAGGELGLWKGKDEILSFRSFHSKNFSFFVKQRQDPYYCDFSRKQLLFRWFC